MLRRSFSLSFLILAAVPWATGWTLLGLWLLFYSESTLEVAGLTIDAPAAARVAAGVAAIGAGQLVFLVFVADRVFPLAHRAVVWPAEMVMSVAIFLGLGFLGVHMIGVA